MVQIYWNTMETFFCVKDRISQLNIRTIKVSIHAISKVMRLPKTTSIGGVSVSIYYAPIDSMHTTPHHTTALFSRKTRKQKVTDKP